MYIFFNNIINTLKKFAKLKSCVFLLFLMVNSTLLFGCSKNIDTYLNSYYFKENKSQQISVEIDEVSENNKYSTTLIASKVTPAIVAISAKNNNIVNIGAGVCVKSGGYVLTNSHVVNGAKSITLYLSNNSTSEAIILWEDEIMDIAILKSSKALPYLPMGDNNKTFVGDDVIAVGTPLSLNFTHTFTKGIISAVNRTIAFSTDCGQSLMQNLIQHDASLNPGNSGGPLINHLGEVIGINTLKLGAAEGIGFAIPINSVISLVNNIYENYNYYPPFIGIFGYDFALENYYADYSQYKGFYISNISENSPAYLAGLKEGDVITEVNATEIINALDFRKELFKYSAKDSIELKVMRGEETISLSIELGFSNKYNLYDIN